jgi:hypothetical protein
MHAQQENQVNNVNMFQYAKQKKAIKGKKFNVAHL